ESVQPAERGLAVQPSHLGAVRALADSLIAAARYKDAESLCGKYLRDPDEAGLGRRGRLATLLAECSGLATVGEGKIGREDPKILVAMGGGIGDILHATPTIRN